MIIAIWYISVTKSFLVEIHDFVFKGIGEVITNRFQATHDIQEIWQEQRTIDDFPMTVPWPLWFDSLSRVFVEMLNEKRPYPMRWFYMIPKQSD